MVLSAPKIAIFKTGRKQIEDALKAGISPRHLSQIMNIMSLCTSGKQNMCRRTYSKTKRKAMSTPQGKPLPHPAFIIFAAVFTLLSVLAIIKGLDTAAAVGTACLYC